MDSLLSQLQPLLADLHALHERLERLLNQRIVSIGGDVNGSVIVLGDNNQITLPDGGRLAQQWRTWLGNQAEVEQAYLQRVAKRYERLLFPLGGLTHPLLLADIYQPLPLAQTNSPDCRTLAGGRRSSLDDLLDPAESGLLLVGNLGQGKSTSLQYLAWVHSHRPADRLHARQGDLLPFLLTASNLAEAWTSGRDPLQAIAHAAAGSHLVLPPDLVEAALRHAMENRAALLLVDAFDEYHASPADRGALLRNLTDFWRSAAPRTPLLISSRPYGLSNPGILQYCFAPLERLHRQYLIYNLARAILRARSPDDQPPDERALQAIQNAILNHPRLSDFDTPFYLTLMVLLACRETTPDGKPDLEQGLTWLRRVERLADLYLYFLRQTIRWELTKPTAPLPDVDERDALLALAESTRLIPDPQPAPRWTPSLSPEALTSLQTFWQRAGVLHYDEPTGHLTFTHAAFYEFAIALGLTIAWQQGYRDDVTKLREKFGQSAHWDLRWLLFHGLVERHDVRFV